MSESDKKPNQEAEQKSEQQTDTGIKTTAKIVLGGESRTIERLRAGDFYVAQGIFAELIKLAVPEKQPLTPENRVSTKEPKTIVELGEKEFMMLLTSMPDKLMKFVSTCAKIPLEELKKLAYPEEIPAAFKVCYELNNVLENLKKFASPLEAVGVGMVEQKKK